MVVKRIAFFFFVFLFVFLLIAASDVAFAQSTTATITGTVTDASAAVLPGVDIVVTNEGTGMVRNALTNESGNYTVPLLPVGTYRVEADLAGFRKAVVRNITVQVDQKARIDLVLQVGQVSEVVDVTGQAPLIQTEDASLGSVIDQRKVIELPLNGRNFETLVQLVPGAVTSPQGSHLALRGGFVVAGMDEHYQSFYLDGFDNVDTIIRNFAYRPSVDVIEEFKVQSSGYQAEFGRNAGAVINVTTKSGTNDFHGAIWEYHRNSAMDAKDFFDPPGKIPGFIRNQFGATSGGRLVRDKTFYFFAYEGLRERRALTRLAAVPPLVYRNGDFSALSKPIIDPQTGQQFPGNRIPQPRWDPVAVEAMPYWPQPNASGSLNLVSTPSMISRYNNVSVKIDHQLTTSNRLTGRYSYANEDIFNPFGGETSFGRRLPNFGQSNPRYRTSAGISMTSLLSTQIVHEFRAGFNRFEQPLIGIQKVPPVQARFPRLIPSFDSFNMSGAYDSLGAGGDFWRLNNTFNYIDNLTINHGNHSFKMGADLRRLIFYNITGSPNTYNFDGRYTQDTFADFLLGLPFSTTNLAGRQYGHEGKFEWAAYFQDDWKATRRLTVNWGIRYEYYRPFTAYNGLSGWDVSTNKIQVICREKYKSECAPAIANPAVYIVQMEDQGPYPVGLTDPDRNNWAPRLGFAFRPLSKETTVIRGSFGIYYDNYDWQKSFDHVKNAPFQTTTTYVSDPRTPQIQLGVNPFPPQLGMQPTLITGAIDRHARDSYAEVWNIGLQHELASSLMVDVSYQGSHTLKQRRTRRINQPLPGPGNPNLRRPYVPFGDLNYTEYAGDSVFDSLQSKVEKRFSKGLTFITSFMWGKAIDDRYVGSNGGPSVPQDSYNIRAERGLSSFDIRRKLTSSYVYELPFGPGKNHLSSGVGSHVLGGWQLSGILTLQGGIPFTPRVARDNSNVGVGADRPNRLGSGVLDHPTPDRWYDVSSFCASISCGLPLYTFGNSGRNILISDGVKTFDLSLTKNHYFNQEKTNIQFRAEFFNVTNHPNFGVPDTFVDRPTAGRVSSTTTTSRQIQLGLRVVY